MSNVRSIRVPGVAAPADASQLMPPGPPRFFDMHGLPVSLGPVPGCPYACACWSTGRPEPLDGVDLVKHGKPLSEAQWRDLITANKLGW